MQCVFAIVLALLMERPLMFWSDLPGKLPPYNVTAPFAPSLRISPAHFTEPFGTASAIFERRLNDLGGFGGSSPSFPDCYLPFAPAPYDSPSNRIIRSYRLYSAAPYMLWSLADFVLDYRQDYGSSLIQDADPPAFGWSSGDGQAVLSQSASWLAAWRDFSSVSNDIPVAAWHLFNGGHYSPPYYMVEAFRYLTLAGFSGDGSSGDGQAGSGDGQAVLGQYNTLLDAIYARPPSDTISNLMSRAVPSCIPQSITNRTLRLDRNFLTALEAAASLEDTSYFYPEDLNCPHQLVFTTATLSKTGYNTATASIRIDPFTETITGTINGSMPSLSMSAHSSTTTNHLSGGNFRYSASIPRNASADWDVEVSDCYFTIPASNLLWAVTTGTQLPDGHSVSLGGEFSFPMNGLYWVGSESNRIYELFGDLPVSYPVRYDVMASTSKSGVFVSPVGINIPSDIQGNNLYWREGRIASAEAFFQEGIRWSNDYDDYTTLVDPWGVSGYEELTPYSTAHGAHRSQKLRHVKTLSLSDPSLFQLTNTWRNALADLQNECYLTFSTIFDAGDPEELCMPRESDLDPAISAATSALASDFDVGVDVYSFYITRSNTVYSVTVRDGLETRFEGILDDSGAPILAGKLTFLKSGSVSLSSTTNLGARVEGDYRSVLRLRTKFFNLSNLP